MNRLGALHDALSRVPPQEVTDPDRREAAVAIVLVPKPDRVLLIVRAERTGDPWSGHLACPGGRREPEDADLLATAIRETCEEVGLDLSRTRNPIQLDDLAPLMPTAFPILVRPFLFLLTSEPPLRLNAEVARYQWVPLGRLAAKGARRVTAIDIVGAIQRVEGYRLDQGLLWGLTERIVTPLVERWASLSREPG